IPKGTRIVEFADGSNARLPAARRGCLPILVLVMAIGTVIESFGDAWINDVSLNDGVTVDEGFVRLLTTSGGRAFPPGDRVTLGGTSVVRLPRDRQRAR